MHRENTLQTRQATVIKFVFALTAVILLQESQKSTWKRCIWNDGITQKMLFVDNNNKMCNNKYKQ